MTDLELVGIVKGIIKEGVFEDRLEYDADALGVAYSIPPPEARRVSWFLKILAITGYKYLDLFELFVEMGTIGFGNEKGDWDDWDSDVFILRKIWENRLNIWAEAAAVEYSGVYSDKWLNMMEAIDEFMEAHYG